jgi:hypothetical protein
MECLQLNVIMVYSTLRLGIHFAEKLGVSIGAIVSEMPNGMQRIQRHTELLPIHVLPNLPIRALIPDFPAQAQGHQHQHCASYHVPERPDPPYRRYYKRRLSILEQFQNTRPFQSGAIGKNRKIVAAACKGGA